MNIFLKTDSESAPTKLMWVLRAVVDEKFIHRSASVRTHGYSNAYQRIAKEYRKLSGRAAPPLPPMPKWLRSIAAKQKIDPEQPWAAQARLYNICKYRECACKFWVTPSTRGQKYCSNGCASRARLAG